VQWVRTRKPKMASAIEQGQNTWVHFSLDKDSLPRVKEIQWRTSNHHFSYQYAKGETGDYPDFVSIVFGNDYKLPDGVDADRAEVCLLNRLESIEDACNGCRRCFGGG
jgi:hypothetical protein